MMQSFEIVGSSIKNRLMISAGPVGFGPEKIDLSHFIIAASYYLLRLTVDGRWHYYSIILAQNKSDRATPTSASEWFYATTA